MLVVSLQGGLGNQMFQYALYRSLQFRGADDVAIDDDYGFRTNPDYEITAHRTPCLKEVFGVDYAVESSPLFIYRKTGRIRDRIFYELARVFGRQYRERGFAFDESVFAMKNAQLIGYWQSEKYFPDAEVQDRLREDFRCPERFFRSDVFSAQADKLRSGNTVALHIRRSDYLSLPEIYGDICTELYYERAIEKMLELVPDASFYVFSDDQAYAQEFAAQHSGKASFASIGVDPDSSEGPFIDFEEFFLMSFCRHHIIANSTYSWWASWLADNPDQVIIAPDKWIHIQKSDDIFTERMIRISGH